MFFKKKKTYQTPGGEYFPIYQQMTDTGHLLIAGQTGSGKSVMLNGIIYSMLAYSAPIGGKGCKFILIDPKRVELYKYSDLPHVLRYCDDTDDTVDALDYAISEMMSRYDYMRKNDLTDYQGTHLYIVIDELADLMTTCKRDILPRLQSLAQLGRAARVHLICCTQSPSRKTIPAELTLNFTDLVALHCRSAIESRQILNESGAEDLPRYGMGIWKNIDDVCTINIPLIKEALIRSRINYWIDCK